jgi:hypothetical protein
MTMYELWVYISELFLGTDNYSIIQGIGDIVFAILVLFLTLLMFLLPFLVMYIVVYAIRSFRVGRL